MTDSPDHRFAARTETLAVRTALLLISTLTVMAGATLAPSLPAMRVHFAQVPGADYWVRLALTLPALLIALSAPIVGVAIDRLGRKPLLLVALVVYGLAGSSGFYLDSLPMILLGRALLGVSVAGIMTTATTLIADYYRGSARAAFLGIQAGFMGLGGVAFLSVGGWLAEINWRWPFLIYGSALLLVPLVLGVLPEPPAPMANLVGEAQREELTPFPVQLVFLTYGVAVLTQAVFYLIPTQLPFYLQTLVQASPSQSGLAIALTTLLSAVSAILYRSVKARLDFVAIYALAFANMAVGYGLISAGERFGVILVGLAITGVGLGLLMPNMNLCLTSVTPDALRGRVLSGITTSVFLGQFLSPLLSQPLSQGIGIDQTFAVAAGLMALVTVGAVLLRGQWPRDPA
ncbi:MAG: MFS transporter [Synechococcales cyanobacterium]